MSCLRSATLAGSSFLALASALTAHAQGMSSATDAAATATIELEEIVVSVRRREELIQDVPQSVQAISGDALVKLNLLNFEDLSKVAPGLSLSRAGSITTMRGVSFNPTAQTNPAVSFYLNEGPVQGAFIFQTMFDVGQFEILRGPQGTLRGQSAPTGAITVTTRRPDLYEFGGTAIAMATDQDGRTLQGALSVPLIKGKFGLRIAGITDENDNGGIESVNSDVEPSLDTDGVRLSARLEPVDDVSAVLTYQQLKIQSLGFGSALFGNGATGTGKSSPGLNTAARQTGYALPSTTVPGYNGPVIPIGRQVAVGENPDRSESTQQFASAQIDYSFLGQKLSYVGGWSKNDGKPGTTFADTANMLVDGDYPSRTNANDLKRWTHELRLGSEETLGGLIDYVVGVFYLDEKIHNDGSGGPSFQVGAFGSPLGAPLAQAPNLRYSTFGFTDIRTDVNELSFFANVMVHLGDRTEVSGGVRFIDAEKKGIRVNSSGAGFRARADLTATTCGAAGGTFGTTYAGVCDVPVAPVVSPAIIDEWSKTPVVYSATLSHHFTDDLMIYLNHGTSWRPGPTQGNLVNGTNDPVLNSFVHLDDEETKSYELGFKSAFFDKRLVFNIAYYHQKYDGLVYSDLTGIPYVSDNGQGVRTLGIAVPMNSNIDATIDGVDLEARFALTDRWKVSGGVSWSDGRYKDQLVPCKDANFDGVPDAGAFSPAQFPAGVLIAQCELSGRSSPTPKWNGTLQSEYSHSLFGNIDGFINGLVTYTPKNPYADPLYEVPDYVLVNLNLGVRNASAGWEMQVFAKNLLDEDKVLSKGSRDVVQGSTLGNLFGAAGYQQISYLPPRQYGIQMSYSFGSR